MALQGLEKGWAPTLEPLGPQNPAQEGLRGPKIAPKGVRTAKSSVETDRRRGQDNNFKVFLGDFIAEVAIS